MPVFKNMKLKVLHPVARKYKYCCIPDLPLVKDTARIFM